MISSMLFISGPEIFIVLVVVLLLFGSNKIPELAKGLGKGMQEFKRATEDIKKELNDSTSDLRKSANEIRKDLDDVKGKISDTSESVYENRKDINKVKEKVENTTELQANAEEAGKETDEVSETPGDSNTADKPGNTPDTDEIGDKIWKDTDV